MMGIAQGNHLLYSTWSIPEFAARKLLKNLKQQKRNPPKYNALGNTTLAAGSAFITKNSTGHNCFTFAKMMLHDLNDERIQVPGDKIDEWIVSAATRYLVDSPGRSKLQFRLIVAAAGITTACLGGGMLYYFF
jgi:hypothetical protein